MFVNALENGTLAICRVVNVAWMLDSNDSAGSAIAAANDRYSRAINAMGGGGHSPRFAWSSASTNFSHFRDFRQSSAREEKNFRVKSIFVSALPLPVIIPMSDVRNVLM